MDYLLPNFYYATTGPYIQTQKSNPFGKPSSDLQPSDYYWTVIMAKHGENQTDATLVSSEINQNRKASHSARRFRGQRFDGLGFVIFLICPPHENWPLTIVVFPRSIILGSRPKTVSRRTVPLTETASLASNPIHPSSKPSSIWIHGVGSATSMLGERRLRK